MQLALELLDGFLNHGGPDGGGDFTRTLSEPARQGLY